MMTRRWRQYFSHLMILGVVLGLVAAPPPSEAGAMAKALMGRLFKRDAARHAVTPARPLTQPRTVNRYTSRAQAEREMRDGLAPNSHMTPNAARGRPLSPEAAQIRYGLPQTPEVRETIHLPSGQLIRHNKALAGEPGRGELTSTQPVSKESITHVVPLK